MTGSGPRGKPRTGFPALPTALANRLSAISTFPPPRRLRFPISDKFKKGSLAAELRSSSRLIVQLENAFYGTRALVRYEFRGVKTSQKVLLGVLGALGEKMPFHTPRELNSPEAAKLAFLGGLYSKRSGSSRVIFCHNGWNWNHPPYSSPTCRCVTVACSCPIGIGLPADSASS
jgi:hypothetical protein